MARILEIRDLSISFRIFREIAKVINGVDLIVDKGETVALVGETGCGKSTVARAIMGALPVPPALITRGEMLFEGRDLLAMDENEKRRIRGSRISMVFQDPMTFINPVFTIGEQLRDIKKWQGKKSVGPHEYLVDHFKKKNNIEVDEAIIDILDKMGLPSPRDVMKRYPVELSGGMRQRVLIGMALINDPELLIADEPGTALDVTIQKQIFDLLRERVERRGISVLYITHNLGVARRLSQKTYIMYAGEIVETAQTENLFRNPMHPYAQGLLDAVPKLTGEMKQGMRGRIPDYISPPEGCRFHPRCDHRLSKCDKVVPRFVELERGHQVRCHLYQ